MGAEAGNLNWTVVMLADVFPILVFDFHTEALDLNVHAAAK